MSEAKEEELSDQIQCESEHPDSTYYSDAIHPIPLK